MGSITAGEHFWYSLSSHLTLERTLSHVGETDWNPFTVCCGDLLALEVILELGYDPVEYDALWAASTGDVIRLLLNKTEPDEDVDLYPLGRMASEDEIILIQELMANGRASSPRCCTCMLISACSAGRSDVVELLAHESCDPDRCNEDAETSLIVAIESRREDIVRLLLAVPDIDADQNGMTLWTADSLIDPTVGENYVLRASYVSG